MKNKSISNLLTLDNLNTYGLIGGPVWKTLKEMRGLGGVKNPWTTHLSRNTSRLGKLGFKKGKGTFRVAIRNFGRTKLGLFTTRLSTAMLIAEGFYDIGLISYCYSQCCNKQP